RDIGLAPSSCRLPLKGGVMRESGNPWRIRGSRFSSSRLRNGLEAPPATVAPAPGRSIMRILLIADNSRESTASP
ncbi:MAG: hypothetical protein OXU61_12990, partial [Gammaproteobacteria bacterium]|nr:hypothetical protein [Gammaproteobacteria bacterium]